VKAFSVPVVKFRNPLSVLASPAKGRDQMSELPSRRESSKAVARTHDDMIVIGDSGRVRKLIGTFAGFQIQSSEFLREATYDEFTDDQRIELLYKAKESAVSAMEVAHGELEQALAYSQLTCATGLIALVRLREKRKNQ
jgi:hypothetical protein